MFATLHPWLTKIVGAVLLVAVLLTILVFLPLHPSPKGPVQLGFTFSVHAAEYLGIDPDEALHAAVADLKPGLMRIPVYWDLVEEKRGTYDWSVIDRQLSILQQGNAKALLAIGHKLPRWPECHMPDWVDDLNKSSAQEAIRDYLTAAVEHYKDRDVVAAWQVENEALFPFGDCPNWSSDRDMLKSEIELVRTLDSSRDIYTTDSGALSLWWRTSTLPVDGIAISLYRAVFNQRVIHWRVNPYFYRLRKALVSPFIKHFMVSELQLEPWGPAPVDALTQEQIDASLTTADFAKRIRFARETGADTVLAWGVEWWYYKLMHDHDDQYWEAAKKAFTR